MCQKVYGMVEHSDWIYWDCDDSDFSAVKFSNVNAPVGNYGNRGHPDIKLFYCVYEPTPGEKKYKTTAPGGGGGGTSL